MRYLKALAVAALTAVAAVLATPPEAWALGTAAGTSIDNRATIDYSVGGVGQTPIESSPAGNSTPGAGNGLDTSFLVDDRVDLVVTNQDGANIIVVPNQTGAITTFRVQNDGNRTHDFRLTAANGGAVPYPPPPADTFDVNLPISIFVEDGTTPGYQVAEDTDTFVDELLADANVDVYVLSDIPGTVVTPDLAVVTLTAIAAEAGGLGVLGADTVEDSDGDDPTLVESVFGDADQNGQHDAQGAYEVSAAALTITKSSTVINDPFNGAVNPLAIPGATVEYTITIANAGPATATNVTVSDDLSTEIGAGTIAFNLDAYAVGFGMALSINGGPATNLSNVLDADQGDWNATAANTVTVNGITLNATDTATITYQVIITYP